MRVRGRLLNYLRPRFKTVDDAEEEYKLNNESLLNSDAGEQISSSKRSVKTNTDPIDELECEVISQNETATLSISAKIAINKFAKIISASNVNQVIMFLAALLTYNAKLNLTNSLWLNLANTNNINNNPADFVSLSLDAMIILMQVNKPNLLYKFACCIAKKRPDSEDSLFPLNRMPFGLVEYQIEFFSCTHIAQVN